MLKSPTYINPTFQLENEGFFLAKPLSPMGGLRAAGTSYSLRRNNWPDRRELRSYPYYTLNMILENGQGFYRNESGFHCELAYGHFVLCFPSFKQLYGPGKGQYWHEMFVNFKGKIFEDYHEQKYFHSGQPVWHLENPQPWIKRLEKLLRAPRPTTKVGVAAETTCFLSLLFEMLDSATPVGHHATTGDWFEKACMQLTRNLHRVDLQEVAQNLGMSYPSFRLGFKQRAGISPYQYREKHRIQMACEALLENPGKLCQEIAFSLGYSRGDHFANQFKRHTGMLPGEYRKKFGRKPPERSSSTIEESTGP